MLLLLTWSSPALIVNCGWDAFLETSSWVRNSSSCSYYNLAYHSTHMILSCVMLSMVFVLMFMCGNLDLTWHHAAVFLGGAGGRCPGRVFARTKL